MSGPVGVALLGAGNGGMGVITALGRGAERYAAQVGRPLELRRVLVRDASRPREGVAAALLTEDIDAVLDDDGTQIVVELMGGEDPAREAMEAHGKSIMEAAGRRGPKVVVEGGAAKK